MLKIILNWIATIVVVILALAAMTAIFGANTGGIIWIILFLLLVFGGGTYATTETVKVYRCRQGAENRWLDSHRWDKSTSLIYRGWRIYVNNPTQEVAIFNANSGAAHPDKIFRFRDIKSADVYQENIKGKNSVHVVIQMIDGKPYAMAVTNRPLPPNSPELQQALSFAKKVNELFSVIAGGNVAGAASGKAFVIAKCFNCGQLLRGEPGRVGWCPKCDAHLQMPTIDTPGVRIEQR